MRTRSLTASLLALFATLLLTGTVLAGGFATVSVDLPPDGPSGGEPIEIDFTVLQHGITPVDHGPMQITLVNRDTGERTTFTATPAGSDGRWTATVTPPAPGEYDLVFTHDLEMRMIGRPVLTVGDATDGLAPLPGWIGLAAGGAALAVLLGFALRRRLSQAPVTAGQLQRPVTR
jgi:hypothetical protein